MRILRYQEKEDFDINVNMAFILVGAQQVEVPEGAVRSFFFKVGKQYVDLRDWVILG